MESFGSVSGRRLADRFASDGAIRMSGNGNIRATQSLQDILRNRQQLRFVGREAQISSFIDNLRLPARDPRKQFVFSISGQGGIGKTSLLRQLREHVSRESALTGWLDEYISSLPDAMASVGADFKKWGKPFEAFETQYQLYRRKKEEIECDPEAPKGLAVLLGKTLTNETFSEVGFLPRGEQGFILLPKQELESQAGEWITYLFKKLADNATVRLFKDPLAVLTPLFLDGLRQAIAVLGKQFVLFIDTFEQTGEMFQPWLLSLLRGHYGDTPAEVQLCIAGRGELDRNDWSEFESITERIELAAFTQEETRTLLEQCGIKDSMVISAVIDLSAGLPLLVAMLAVQRPTDQKMIEDPASTAVSRFLKWIQNVDQRNLLLDASLPRLLNAEILAKISNGRSASFEWLRTMPFVQRSPGGWVYHPVVRQAMLREKRLESPAEWYRMHGELAQHYEDRLKEFPSDEDRNLGSVSWQNGALEAMYHRLCEAHDRIDVALCHFLRGLSVSKPLAWRWVRCIGQAGDDSQNQALVDWGRDLTVAMEDYELRFLRGCIAGHDAHSGKYALG